MNTYRDMGLIGVLESQNFPSSRGGLDYGGNFRIPNGAKLTRKPNCHRNWPHFARCEIDLPGFWEDKGLDKYHFSPLSVRDAP